MVCPTIAFLTTRCLEFAGMGCDAGEMLQPHFHNASLTINLSALVRNWQRLDRLSGSAETAAAVKANAYGLGAEAVTMALARGGCRTFFVANPVEGQEVLRGLNMAGVPPNKGGHPEKDAGAGRIYVLNGVPPRGENDLASNRMRPVLNSLADIAQWRSWAYRRGREANCAIHIDTGMTRLGLLRREIEQILDDPTLLEGLHVDFWMTHLACADERDHPMNHEQLSLFHDRIVGLPQARLSIANSAGIFLGEDWHLDLCRPGIALYGSNPESNDSEPMEEVVHAAARILEVHRIERDRTIGYGATHPVAPGTRIATCGVGYADGYIRSLSGKGFGVLAGHWVPLVGRVSMDLVTFDVTDVPEQVLEDAEEISIIGGGVDIDELAASGGTIAYELLTGLGHRFARKYV